MLYAYSPDTGELINTEAAADWMGVTDVPPPAFDPAAQGCFWRRASWEVVDAAPVAPPVPAAVTMRQARLALLQSGLLAQVNSAVAGMAGSDGDAARIEWEFSATVERHRPLVQALSATLGLTDAQLDDLFILAATL